MKKNHATKKEKKGESLTQKKTKQQNKKT